MLAKSDRMLSMYQKKQCRWAGGEYALRRGRICRALVFTFGKPPLEPEVGRVLQEVCKQVHSPSCLRIILQNKSPNSLAINPIDAA